MIANGVAMDAHEPQGSGPLILINGSLDGRGHSSVYTSVPMGKTTVNNGEVPPSDHDKTMTKDRSKKPLPPEEAVVLPDRFRRYRHQRLETVNSGCVCRYDDTLDESETQPAGSNGPGCHSNKKDYLANGTDGTCSVPCSCSGSTSTRRVLADGTPEERARDVTIALQWLRQQMMKAQDKVLMRQFLELRASIHGLRAVGVSPRSAIDLSCSSRAPVTLLPVTVSPSVSLPRLNPDDHEEEGRTRVTHGLLGDECEVEFRARTVSMVPARPRSKLQIRAFSKEFV